jgi:predicted nuclease of restriction endonuclease-like (RecB) superfamily
MAMASREIALPDDYQDLLKVLKERVRGTRAQAVRSVNSQLIGLYWSIGRDILQRQDAEGWGSGVNARLGEDLRAEFPEMKGFSRRNLQYMAPWGHLMVLVDKLSARESLDW